MKPAKIGAVLAAMEAARAQDLTVLLARRMKVTLNTPAAPAAPAAAPVARTCQCGPLLRRGPASTQRLKLNARLTASDASLRCQKASCA
jgi:hypothetical protein